MQGCTTFTAIPLSIFDLADYEDARQKYADAMHTLGYQADLAYNTALCYFKDKQYVSALKHVGELSYTLVVLGQLSIDYISGRKQRSFVSDKVGQYNNPSSERPCSLQEQASTQELRCT